MFMILLFIPLIYADNMHGGGGGSSIPLEFTYEECNELLDNKIQQANDAYETYSKRAGILGLWLITIFLLSIIYILIVTGMNIQQIKDKGMKKWWKSKWHKT